MDETSVPVDQLSERVLALVVNIAAQKLMIVHNGFSPGTPAKPERYQDFGSKPRAAWAFHAGIDLVGCLVDRQLALRGCLGGDVERPGSKLISTSRAASERAGALDPGGQ